jgi:pimeloyl-ACP methyl ester carboxylesterase
MKRKGEITMPTITSKDGTKIAFDKVGSGPAVILINGAMSYRAFDPTLGQLAELLGKYFTAYDYDRRGRGESGDTKPFTKQREIEDVQALMEDAGGEAMLFGVSSGGAIALETAAITPGVTKVVVYEVPFIVDDSREPLEDYEGYTTKLAAEGKLDELLEYFGTKVVGIPAEDTADMEMDQGMWAQLRCCSYHSL